METHRRRVDGIMRALMMRESNEATDLAQQTYLRALCAADRFELREHGVRLTVPRRLYAMERS